MSSTITYYDNLLALKYAQNQVLKAKCGDPKYKDFFCKDRGKDDCFTWSTDGLAGEWNIPSFISDTRTCKTDKDCTKVPANEPPSATSCIDGQCSWKPDSSDVGKGYCTLTKNGCDALSESPYTCDGEKCLLDEKKMTSLFSWDKDSDQCVYRNWMLKMYCEEPKTREGGTSSTICEPPDDKSDVDCDTDRDKCHCYIQFPKKLDDQTKPFYYNVHKDRCYITKSYCDNFATYKFENRGKSSENNKCTTDDTCADDDVCVDGACAGPTSQCYVPGSTKALEFIIPKTALLLVENLFEGKLKPCKENFTILDLKKYMEDQLPDQIEAPSDFAAAESTHIAQKDAGGGGLHLYLIEWRSRLPVMELGFDARAVKKQYPSIVKKMNGEMYIVIKKSDGARDKNVQKIFVLLSTRNKLLGQLGKEVFSKKN